MRGGTAVNEKRGGRGAVNKAARWQHASAGKKSHRSSWRMGGRGRSWEVVGGRGRSLGTRVIEAQSAVFRCGRRKPSGAIRRHQAQSGAIRRPPSHQRGELIIGEVAVVVDVRCAEEGGGLLPQLLAPRRPVVVPAYQEVIRRPSGGHQEAIRRSSEGHQECIKSASRGDQEGNQNSDQEGRT